MRIKRGIFCGFLVLLILSLSLSSEALGAVNWQQLSGTWRPVSGTSVFYSHGGRVVNTYKLSPKASDNMQISITKHGKIYNVSFNDGIMNFIQHEDSPGRGIYTGYMYDSFNGRYNLSGRTLSIRVKLGEAGVMYTAFIKYIDKSRLQIVIDNDENRGGMVSYTSASRQVSSVDFVRAAR